MATAAQKFKLVFFCPTKNTHEILSSLFLKYPLHIGKIGEYDNCAFLTQGIGQFRPIGSANPAIGEIGKIEKVEEHRVEVLVLDDGSNNQIRDTVKELKKVHPYEEVAYDVYRLEDF